MKRSLPPYAVRFLAAAMLCALVCGCGQKGDLFLPDDTAARLVQTQP